MLDNIHELDIDIKQHNYIDEPILRQNDDVVFVINVMDDNIPFDLTNVSTTTLTTERADDNKIISAGATTGINQITFKLPRSSVAIVGKSKAIVQMYGVDNRVSTFAFPFRVEKDPSGSEWTPDDGEKTLIEIVLGEGPKVIRDAEEATEEAKAATADVKAIKDATEVVRESTESERVATKGEREKTELARLASENATSDALEAADYATQEADDARTQKELVKEILADGPVVSVNGKTGIVDGLAEQDELVEVKAHLTESVTDANRPHGMGTIASQEYEEGAFTPSLNKSDAEYKTRTGKYTRIGNRVFINLEVTLSMKGASIQGIAINGLPFTTSKTPVGQKLSAHAGRLTDATQIYAVTAGSSVLYIYESDANETFLSPNKLTDETSIKVSGFYII